ncbi:MAG: hypothetical protein K8S62_02315 [Candidatus Sabulitectum sp.]|nr:hypothetical protein [Candidatus Sabulitectum sp.]
MWWKTVLVALIVLAFIIAAASLYGRNRWQSDTEKLLAQIEALRTPITPELYDSRELEGLPAPVQRYFRAVLKEGQPLISSVSVEHTGTFNMSETGEQWKPFMSSQRVITQRPGFVWDARIRMAPGLTVHVHDAYVAGEGILTAKLFGLLTVMNQPNTPELSQGELMRFFAEATWYPTALLPSQGVVWEAINDTLARATLTDGTTTVKLVFQFNTQGLISSVHSDGRYREVDGAQTATPWLGSFDDYELRGGMLIPLEGEVAWLLPEGPAPYWRGRIQQIEYE